MNGPKLVTLSNPWFARSVLGLVLLALFGLLVGFVWMPARNEGEGAWDAFCRAAGVPVVTPTSATRVANAPSEVVMSEARIEGDSTSVGRGATLALRCTMCHGVRGLSQANSPNLAGQRAEVVYKQLRDYKAGKRKSEVMVPLVRDLSDNDMRDLAAYYAYLPRNPPPANLLEQLRAPVLVQQGAPMRNVAPCASCHGGSETKFGSPLLDGEPAQYLADQMHAFARGTRANDIEGQMRNIARQMTPDEIEATARYYAQR